MSERSSVEILGTTSAGLTLLLRWRGLPAQAPLIYRAVDACAPEWLSDDEEWIPAGELAMDIFSAMRSPAVRALRGRIPLDFLRPVHCIPVLWGAETSEQSEARSQRSSAVLVPEFTRASGDCLCPSCGLAYRIHPRHALYWLIVLCDGKCVHL